MHLVVASGGVHVWSRGDTPDAAGEKAATVDGEAAVLNRGAGHSEARGLQLEEEDLGRRPGRAPLKPGGNRQGSGR